MYCGRKAHFSIGNGMPIGNMSEGTIVCNLEEKTGDRGKLARASGNNANVIAHNPDTMIPGVKLPSGSKKVVFTLTIVGKDEFSLFSHLNAS